MVKAEKQRAYIENLAEYHRQRTLNQEKALGHKPVETPSVPRMPSEMERAAHEVMHIPAEDACEDCVLGKALEAGHRAVPTERKLEKAVVQIDYSFLKASGEECDAVEDAFATTLSAYDESTGMALALAILRKQAH